MFEDFYGTFATVSLTVTGLWMYVASSRFRDWMADRDHFRRASAVSVQLAFPGLMCLFALIEPDSTTLWRIAFGVTSGIAVVLLLSSQMRSARPWPRANRLGNLLAAALFAGIGVIALVPESMDDLVSEVPRRIEFFLFCLLLIDGLVVAWIMLFEESRANSDDLSAEATRRG